jgi:hypothetical protein
VTGVTWAPDGANEQYAIVGRQRLTLHHAQVIDENGRKRHLGWDGYRDGHPEGRWFSEKAAKRALERRAGAHQ